MQKKKFSHVIVEHKKKKKSFNDYQIQSIFQGAYDNYLFDT